MASARTTRLIPLVLACATAAFSCATRPAQSPQRAQLTRAVEPPDRKTAPEPLSNTARAILRTRMGSHTRDMTDLVAAIMVLDYPRIGEDARAISADASLARPLTHDATELASAIPGKFFDLQDDLRAHGRLLAAAAEHQDPLRVADAYGRLSETCVRCHAAYREGRSRR